MPTTQQAQSGTERRQGCRPQIAELRRSLANPSTLCDGHRQRLLELAQRLARVQALGGEFARVQLSQATAAAMEGNAAVV